MCITDTDLSLDDVMGRLYGVGLLCVGASQISRSTYWAVTRDGGMPRLRLSDHAVAYPSSDCEVCVGDSPDDDYGLDEWADAARALWAATVRADRDTATEQAEEDGVDATTAADEAEQSCIRHAREYNRKLASFLGLDAVIVAD